MLNTEGIQVHFIGIGGIGMSGIAEVLLSMGYKVTGSDAATSDRTKVLEEKGATIFLGHAKEHAENATVIVYSSAIDNTNPEIIIARENNIPIMKRAEMLAELMRLKKGVAVAGTHGKTTTTSILATILQESRFDPTYIIGGIVHNLKGHAKVGTGEYLVAEADESDGSFLLLNPVLSVITNIDNDHLDFYGSEEALHEAFLKFEGKVPFYGKCSINAHDPTLMRISKKFKKPFVTFGVADDLEVPADYEARNLKNKGFETSFDLFYKNEFISVLNVPVAGRHNTLNSLGAISAAHIMGVPFEKIVTSIAKFEGVGRRMQLLHSKKDFKVIDDYGHHPTEISATIKAVREAEPKKKLIVVFEPHRFSRTRDCWNDFFHCFNNCDKVYMAPIYPASEKPIAGITSNNLSSDINKIHPNLVEDLKNIKDLDTIISKYDSKDATILTLGAGSIGKHVREWTSKV